MLEGIYFLYIVLEMNALNGIFYKGKMFQPKYHWVEIKYLGAIQNRRGQLFCLRDNAFSQYTPWQLLRVDVCLKGCVSIQYIFKNLYKYSKYSDLNSLTQNAWLRNFLFTKQKLKSKISTLKTGTVADKITRWSLRNKLTLHWLEYKIEKLNFLRRYMWCPTPVREWLIFPMSQTNIKIFFPFFQQQM